MEFKEIDNSGTVELFALVKSCDKKTSKNGSFYLDINLSAPDGEINGKLWDYKEGTLIPKQNTIIKVRGHVSEYNGQPQLRIERIREVEDSDNINISEYIPTSELTGERMLSLIKTIVSQFKDNDLKLIVEEILSVYGEGMTVCPAAFRLHHAIIGGLLQHTLAIVRLCQQVANIYPSVDKELLISGAILHDVCKIDEFIKSPVGLVDGYTTEGVLIGHLAMGAMLIEKVAEETGAKEETAVLLEHMLLSHHGEPEFGSPVRPLFLEAEILNQLDTLDAKIYEIEQAVSDVAVGEFTQRQWALNDRRFFNHGRKNISTKVNLE